MGLQDENPKQSTRSFIFNDALEIACFKLRRVVMGVWI